jgi:hypothetical protein
MKYVPKESKPFIKFSDDLKPAHQIGEYVQMDEAMKMAQMDVFLSTKSGSFGLRFVCLK